MLQENNKLHGAKSFFVTKFILICIIERLKYLNYRELDATEDKDKMKPIMAMSAGRF